jgi:hypothetical protein
MTSDKTQRVATAVSFLSGVLACTNAVRDVKTLWPPDVVWQAMSPPHRLEFGAGMALIVVTLIVSIATQISQPR